MTPPPDIDPQQGLKFIRTGGTVFVALAVIMLLFFRASFRSPPTESDEAPWIGAENRVLGRTPSSILCLYFLGLGIGFFLRLRLAWKAASFYPAMVGVAIAAELWRSGGPPPFGGRILGTLVVIVFFTFQTVRWCRDLKRHKFLFA